jgi:hypothetical protein
MERRALRVAAQLAVTFAEPGREVPEKSRGTARCHTRTSVDRASLHWYVRLQEGSGVACGIPASGPDTGTRPD